MPVADLLCPQFTAPMWGVYIDIVFEFLWIHLCCVGPKAGGEGKSALSEGKSGGGSKTSAGEGKFSGK